MVALLIVNMLPLSFRSVVIFAFRCLRLARSTPSSVPLRFFIDLIPITRGCKIIYLVHIISNAIVVVVIVFISMSVAWLNCFLTFAH